MSELILLGVMMSVCGRRRLRRAASLGFDRVCWRPLMRSLTFSKGSMKTWDGQTSCRSQTFADRCWTEGLSAIRGGSLFRGLKLPAVGTRYAFSQVTTVSGLINHAKLAVGDDMFPVLATAFPCPKGFAAEAGRPMKSVSRHWTVCLAEFAFHKRRDLPKGASIGVGLGEPESALAGRLK